MPQSDLVLIVDDDAPFRRLVQKHLGSEGYQFIEAENGQLALDACLKHQPALVLLDCQMPELDGFGVLEALRKLEGVNDMVVVMLSTSDDETSIGRAFGAGAADYVIKPPHWPLLRHRLRRLRTMPLYEQTLITLANERNLLRTLIDHLPDYVFVKDTVGRFLVTNEANTAYLGQTTPREVIGRTDDDFFEPARAAAFRQDEQAIMATGQPMLNVEVGVQNSPDEPRRWYAITKVPWHLQDGSIAGIIGMIREITQQKASEEQMHLVNQRLQEVNDLKSHFLLTMSHELRTPLNSILGYTDMLRTGLMGELTEQQQDRLSRVHRNGEILLSIINDILDLSRIQTGQMHLQLGPVALADVLAQYHDAFASQAAAKGLDLRVTLPEDLPPLDADPEALGKIVRNLLSNGVKFTDEGYVRLRARALPAAEAFSLRPEFMPRPTTDDDDAPDWVLIEVTDSGPGISAELQAHIFDEFRQVDSSSTRAKGGTGLGLALCRQLCELMGGTIWVESALGEGSTFLVLLPIARSS
ncbi:MAG: ATP-binding protein [Anaerolineales bacterium]